MSEHVCPRCGHEDHCGYGSWVDRHPVLAVIGGLVGGVFTLVWMTAIFAVYPLAAWSMTGIVAGAAGVRAVGRRQRRRQALRARADYEHAVLMARNAMPPLRLQPREPQPQRSDIAERHVLNRWPTTPIRTRR